MNPVRRWLLYLLFLMPLAPAYADNIEVIELQHRPAAGIIPILQPMLDEGGSITGKDFEIFVRTSPENLDQLRQMVRKLDVASKQLVISVFQGNDRDLRALSMSGGLDYDRNNIDASIGNSRTPERGGSIHYSTRGASATGSTISTRGRLTENPIQQLRITDGTPGYIETGQSIPYFSGGYWLQPGMEYRDVPTGFYVLPRVHGDQVTLDISPYKQALSKTHTGAIDTQRASTQITGRLGEWLQIGGTTESIQRSSSSTGSRISTESRNNSSIWIKAELQP